MPDYSLDQFVAQAVEPMPSDPEVKVRYVLVSPLRMWYWDTIGFKWEAVNVSDSIENSMRVYILFWEKTGWRLIELKHVASEDWLAILTRSKSVETGLLTEMRSGKGTTAAIAICEAIKAASLVDTKSSETETEVRS